MEISEILEKQRAYYQTGVTFDVDFRINMLKKLHAVITKYEKEMYAALKQDLGKSDFEAFICENGMILSEITYMIRHVKKYASRKIVWTPLAQFASVSYRQPSPYGNVLIMSPWNYPFMLTLEPLADAIAAGNTAILKPSAYSPASSALMEKMISEVFTPDYIAVVTGGRRENAELLNHKFDFVFFTGSSRVGKEVLRHTAEHLTPAVLELGGKSPCIVDDTAKLKLAAKRIVFGKFLNCGQTCVAPDYLLVQKNVKDRLIHEILRQIRKQYGSDPFRNKDYGKIVNEKHYQRILSLIDEKKIATGGTGNPETLQIAPTVLDNVTWDDACMQEEIFGPVLPVLTFDKIEDLFPMLQNRPKPLALYMYSEDKKNIRKITEGLSFGGGCVNDCIIHLATSEMGFGGVGESGMGSYHGKIGFDTFSHTKSIVDKKTWMDLPMRYQPYHRFLYSKLLHFFFK